MKGYLETSYLGGAYLSAVDEASKPSQVVLVIKKDTATLAQVGQKITAEHPTKSQAKGLVAGKERLTLAQVTKNVAGAKSAKAQVDRAIAKTEKTLNAQTKLAADGLKATHGEVRLGKISFFLSTDLAYLKQGYLAGPYLAPYMGAQLKSQLRLKTSFEQGLKQQVELRIDDKPSARKAQVEGRITKEKATGAQVNRIRLSSLKAQATIALYNTDNLRILYNFPSRGRGVTAGVNWTASSQMAGHFSPNNLNSDIVEEVYRSNNEKTGVILSCDTGVPQGVFVDTFAMLSHNLTTSAVVQFQGSDAADFSSVGFDQRLTIKKKNTYWMSPELPLSSYRYWRLVINDPTNTNAYLEIGTVVFGKAMIFQGECFVDEVTRTTKHFADKVETEGFTNVTVDRAVKYAVGLEFRNLAFEKGNYNRLRDFFDACRTGLKALWVPTPKFPDRFAVFGKLTAIPVERHNVKGEGLDYVDFSCEVDESL